MHHINVVWCLAGVWEQWCTPRYWFWQSLCRHVHSWCGDNGGCLRGKKIFVFFILRAVAYITEN